jgi:alpha-D-xyloside xylohydrolase
MAFWRGRVMKRGSLAGILFLPLLAPALAPAIAQAQSPWQAPASAGTSASGACSIRGANGVLFKVPGGKLAITVWGDRIVRVVAGVDIPTAMPNGPAVLGAPATVAWTLGEEAGRFILSTPAMRISIAKADGAVALLGADRTLLRGDNPLVPGACARRP